MEFDHVGYITDVKQGEEDFVEATRVWVTNPKDHPYKVEWLRFEPDTPVTGPVRDKAHVAYKVESLDKEIKERNLKVLLEPFEVGGFLRVGFFEYEDGTILELMEYLGDDKEWFGKK